MRLVKATLLVAIGTSLLWMWSSREYIIAAYQPSPDAPQVRLSGIDLAVARPAIDPSPFTMLAAPDTRARPIPALAAAKPEATDVVSMTDGTAELQGTVTGPDGLPVEGANVRLQRHTSRGSATMLLSTDASGSWSAPGLPGGRYRAMAWVPGVMTSGGSTVVFLAEDESRDLPFSLWGVDPAFEFEFVHSGELFYDIPGTLAVVVSSKIIDDRGVVLTVPVVAAPVTIETTQHLTVLSAPLQYTGNDGAARFAVICPRPSVETTAAEPVVDAAETPSVGIGTLIARSGELVEGFALPPCVPPPALEPVDQSPSEQANGSREQANG